MREGKRLHERVVQNIQKKKEEGKVEEIEEGVNDEKISKKESLHERSVKKLQVAKKEAKEFMKPSMDRQEKACEEYSVKAYKALKAYNVPEDRRTPGWERPLTKEDKQLMKDFERGLQIGIGGVSVESKKAIRTAEDYIERIKSFIEEMKTHENNLKAQEFSKNAKIMLVSFGKEAMKNNDPKIAKQIFDYTNALEDFPMLGKVVGALSKQKERSEQKKLEKEKESQSQISRDKGYAAYMALTQGEPQEKDPLAWEISNFIRSLKEKSVSAGFSGMIRIKEAVRKPEDYIREVERELKKQQSTVGLENMPYMKEAIKWLRCLLEGFGKAAKEKGDKDIKKRIDEILGNVE